MRAGAFGPAPAERRGNVPRIDYGRPAHGPLNHPRPGTMSDPRTRKQGGVGLKSRPRTKRPQRFRVLLYNDDYTTMEFVVVILESIFKHSPAEAVSIMLDVHNSGRGTAGVYPFEVAESKVLDVHGRARSAGYPLRAGMEEE